MVVRYGQEHLLAHWDTLTEDERSSLYNEIKVSGDYIFSSVFRDRIRFVRRHIWPKILSADPVRI
jgi:hypothetical protein